jgi:hypothetical protein
MLQSLKVDYTGAPAGWAAEKARILTIVLQRDSNGMTRLNRDNFR